MKRIAVALLALLVILTGCTVEDEAGNIATLEDNRLSTMSKSYLIGVAEGDIPDHSDFLILGYNDTVGTSQEDIWFGSTTYTFPTVGQQMELVSTSIQDDTDVGGGVPGTGILTVTVTYLDSNYVEHTEDVNLDGTTVVTTVANDIFRVNSLRAKTCGTGYAAAGDISIRNLADTPVYRYIPTGFTRCRDGIYTVPANKTMYITQWSAGNGGLAATDETRIILRATYDDANDAALTAGLFFMPHAEKILPNFESVTYFSIPERMPEKTDVKVSGFVNVGSSFVSIALRGWVESN